MANTQPLKKKTNRGSLKFASFENFTKLKYFILYYF